VATSGWPITIADVLQARTRLKERLHPTPLRSYAALDAEVGHDIRVSVKHENHQPTQSFKVRNALSAMTMLSPDEAQRGVVGATRGNHGAGLAWAGQILHIPVTICVPKGNSAEKNEAMRGLGATLVEKGSDYDAAVKVADKLVQEQGMTLVHSTNNRRVIAGAGDDRAAAHAGRDGAGGGRRLAGGRRADGGAGDAAGHGDLRCTSL
jgi:threonine dehydratase